MSGRARSEISADRWQKVWWYLRHGYSQRAIARKLSISVGTVSYYVKRGLPDYDWRYDTDRKIPDDLLTDSELRARKARTTNVRQPEAQQPGKSHVSPTPRSPRVASLDAHRRRQA
jgi:Winged helix-turn-helix DNA-binding